MTDSAAPDHTLARLQVLPTFSKIIFFQVDNNRHGRNAEQQKKNNDERATLVAQKLEIKTRAVIAGLKNKATAEKACTSMSTAEGQACCPKVMFDGADPKLCSVEAMCEAFEHGGMFGSGLVICKVASK